MPGRFECGGGLGLTKNGVRPGDTVIVAKDRELPHDDPDTLSDFIPCRTEDAVPATVIGHDDWWLSFRMPDGTTDRVLALGFKDTGQCTSGRFRAHPRHEEFRKQGIYADYPAPETWVFHPDVFQEVLRKE